MAWRISWMHGKFELFTVTGSAAAVAKCNLFTGLAATHAYYGMIPSAGYA